MNARGPYAKGIVKREEILKTALKLFADKGYDKVSVREIAREAGLSQAGLLHHFSSKEELFLEALRRRDDHDGEFNERAREREHSIAHLIEAVDRNTDERGLVRLFVSMSAESTEEDSLAYSFFVDRYAWLRTEIANDVRRHQERSELAADLDPEDIASLLIAVADGMQLQWLLEPEKVDMPKLLRTLWALLQRA